MVPLPVVLLPVVLPAVLLPMVLHVCLPVCLLMVMPWFRWWFCHGFASFVWFCRDSANGFSGGSCQVVVLTKFRRCGEVLRFSLPLVTESECFPPLLCPSAPKCSNTKAMVLERPETLVL